MTEQTRPDQPPEPTPASQDLFKGVPSIAPPSDPPEPSVTSPSKRPFRLLDSLKAQYGCPPGCTPMNLAGLYSTLPWRWVVTLTAPPGRLMTTWNAWHESGWDRVSAFDDREPPTLPRLTFRDHGAPEMSLKHLTAAERLLIDRNRDQLASLNVDAFPFWLAVMSSHGQRTLTKNSKSIEKIVTSGVAHIHMLLGGIDYRPVRRLLKAWPWITDLKAIYSPRRILHYCLAQRLRDEGHFLDPWSTPLLRPPLESWNLEVVLMSHRHRERMERRRLRRLTRNEAARRRRYVRRPAS